VGAGAAGTGAAGKGGAGIGSAGSGAGPRAAWLPWAATGTLALVVIAVLVVRDDGREIIMSPPPAAPAGTLGPTSAIDLNSMTPRQAADRLFRRVMGAVEAGDQAEANLFLPMAIASYDLIEALSLDDRFHLSLLYAVAEDGPSALAVAEAGLAFRPTHLLCLAAAAEAALLLGDDEKAAGYYQTLVDVYDEEILAGLEEYGTGPTGHASLLPRLRADALAYLAGSG